MVTAEFKERLEQILKDLEELISKHPDVLTRAYKNSLEIKIDPAFYLAAQGAPVGQVIDTYMAENPFVNTICEIPGVKEKLTEYAEMIKSKISA